MAGACSGTSPAGPRDSPAIGRAAAPRALPRTLYGVTADEVSSLGQLVASSRHLPEMPVTRIYFDVTRPPGYYAAAVRKLHPVSYLMGELLDSSDETSIGVAAYARRTRAYLNAFGAAVDIWEIGNEVNGNWTGPYPVVAAKLAAAYHQVAARHLRTALTLYYNAGCGDGPAELDPLAFSAGTSRGRSATGSPTCCCRTTRTPAQAGGRAHGPGPRTSARCTRCTRARGSASARSGCPAPSLPGPCARRDR